MIYNLFIIGFIYSEIIEQCDIPVTDDYIITKFYKDKCGPCDRISNFIEEIDSRLERNGNGLIIRYVNCSKCNCLDIKVNKVPAITVHKDGVELDKLVGYRDFGEIVEFLSKNTGIDRRIFKKRIKSTPGKVVSLKERDFLTGFDGPWLILFFNTKSDIKRELIEQMAEDYESSLNIGELNGNLVPGLVKRFSISYLPTLIGIYNGVLVGYNGKDEVDSLKAFIDELLSPSFPDISFNEFTEIENKIPKGDPIFIVFYKDLGAANEYFKSIAHEYKFRAKIYKSADPALILKAGVNLDNDDIILTVYRNKSFLETHTEITDREKVFQWIFQAHYPYLTRINNDNFYAIFHGIKPVVLLITRGDDLVIEFEQISESTHNGMPFIDKLFSAIDVNTYSLFIPSLLPKIRVPSVVILNPTTTVFYTKNVKITANNIKEVTEKMIEEYDLGKLEIYPTKKITLKNIFILSLTIIILIWMVKRTLRKKLKVVEH